MIKWLICFLWGHGFDKNDQVRIINSEGNIYGYKNRCKRCKRYKRVS